MAKKSKTQRAKASANRAARKAQAQEAAKAQVEVAETEASKPKSGKKIFSGRGQESSKEKSDAKKKPKKDRLSFFKDVRSELKRVTWPTKQDVLRWSGVVVVALLFFGVFVALLDNVIITPVLIAFSGLGA